MEQLALTSDGRLVVGDEGAGYSARPGWRRACIARAAPGLGLSQLALTGDGRVVSRGYSDGRVFCARLDGGEPVLLAQHERGVAAAGADRRGSRRDRWPGRPGVLRAAGWWRATTGRPQHEHGGLAQLALTGDGRVVPVAQGRPGVLRAAGGRRAVRSRIRGRGLAVSADRRWARRNWRLDGRVYCGRLEGGEPVCSRGTMGRRAAGADR